MTIILYGRDLLIFKRKLMFLTVGIYSSLVIKKRFGNSNTREGKVAGKNGCTKRIKKKYMNEKQNG